MNEPTTHIDPPDTASVVAPAVHPSGILMTLIVAYLAPMFLGVTAGDLDLAKLAATETVNDYRRQNHADLLSIAQIIAFGLAALGSLSLSMTDDISLSMTLRLRANANACNRSAEQHRRALANSVGTEAVPGHAEVTIKAPAATTTDLNEAALLAGVAAVELLAAEAHAPRHDAPPATTPDPSPAAPASAPRDQTIWATAMADAAGKLTAGLVDLPPASRRSASIRAAALSGTANGLLNGAFPLQNLYSTA